MKQKLKNCVIGALGMAGAFPTGRTGVDELRGLIGRLRPVGVGRPMVRLGPAGDGGYLVPDDLAGLSGCFSPGVSTESGFERACAELGMPVYLADKSVDGPAEAHPLFHFTKKFLGVTTNDDFMTLDDWVGGTQGNGDLLLQIDIEGWEYEVFLAASDALMRRFRVIVVEFHELDWLWSRPFFRLAGRAFDKILQTHACVHLHPNNCCGMLRSGGLEIPRVMEFTFVRRDRLGHGEPNRRFPHALDHDNMTAHAPLPLPECWYRGGEAE